MDRPVKLPSPLCYRLRMRDGFASRGDIIERSGVEEIRRRSHTAMQKCDRMRSERRRDKKRRLGEASKYVRDRDVESRAYQQEREFEGQLQKGQIARREAAGWLVIEGRKRRTVGAAVGKSCGSVPSLPLVPEGNTRKVWASPPDGNGLDSGGPDSRRWKESRVRPCWR